MKSRPKAAPLAVEPDNLARRSGNFTAIIDPRVDEIALAQTPMYRREFKILGAFPIYTVTNHTPRRKLAAAPDHELSRLTAPTERPATEAAKVCW
jgi:hypothetical protein